MFCILEIILAVWFSAKIENIIYSTLAGPYCWNFSGLYMKILCCISLVVEMQIYNPIVFIVYVELYHAYITPRLKKS